MIELVCVIVIMGTLAATAVPKFISLKGSAARAVLDGVQGNVASAMNIAYVKCLAVPGCSGSVPKVITIGAKSYNFYNGYPNAGETVGSGIDIWIDTSGVTVLGVSMYNTRFQVTNSANPASCYVDYREAVSYGSPPTITSVTTGC